MWGVFASVCCKIDLPAWPIPMIFPLLQPTSQHIVGAYIVFKSHTGVGNYNTVSHVIHRMRFKHACKLHIHSMCVSLWLSDLFSFLFTHYCLGWWSHFLTAWFVWLESKHIWIGTPASPAGLTVAALTIILLGSRRNPLHSLLLLGSRWQPLFLQGSRWRPLFLQGSRWQPVLLQGSRWQPLLLLGSRWQPLFLQGSRWQPVLLQGSRWQPLFLLGSRWQPLFLLGSRWQPLFLLGSRWQPLFLLGSRWQPLLLLGSRWHPLLLLGSRWHPLLQLGSR